MRSAISALVLALAMQAQAGEPVAAPSVQLLVQNSRLAGFRYAEAKDVWPSLRVGDVLELRRDPGNPHDGNAVRVLWRGRMLGYVPRRENAALAWGMDRGERVGARISRLLAHPNPARRIEFEVYVE